MSDLNKKKPTVHVFIYTDDNKNIEAYISPPEPLNPEETSFIHCVAMYDNEDNSGTMNFFNILEYYCSRKVNGDVYEEERLIEDELKAENDGSLQVSIEFIKKRLLGPDWDRKKMRRCWKHLSSEYCSFVNSMYRKSLRYNMVLRFVTI